MAEPAAAEPLTERSLEAYRGELLELGFEFGTKIPVFPHITDRSITQAEVVEACFELGQHERALRYAEGIDDWREGQGYVDYALYLVENGQTAGVEPFLERARENAHRHARHEDAQEWQHDRVMVKVARVYTLLGRDDLAEELSEGVSDSEQGKLEATRARVSDEDDFDDRFEALEELLDANHLDLTMNALTASVELLDRFYGDEEKRERIKALVASTWEKKIPLQVRIEAVQDLAEVAVRHGDQALALEWVDEAKAVVDSAEWLPEDTIKLNASIAKSRFLAGDEERARQDADAMFDLYVAERDRIVDIWRAGTLCPLADAYAAMGDDVKALSLYGRAVEEGVQNPNSRPHAQDLSEICISMAVAGVEPPESLWNRMREIYEGLDDPW